MKYKKSYYNVEVKSLENGDLLIFNTLSVSFGILKKEFIELYENIGSITDELTEEEKEQVKIMSENGFLINEEVDELGFLEVREKLYRYSTNAYKGLTIAPTLNCNMDCPYCYEAKTNNNMSDEVKNTLVNFVKKYIVDAKGLSITWYGGEPLLEKNTIKELSNEFIEMCKEADIPYSASIVTNGILLDYETAKMLKEECKVNSAQVTIDGMKDVHNSRRKLKGNGDSFEIITQNVDNIKDILSISIRVNIDKTNFVEMERLAEYFLIKKNWNLSNNVMFYFAPVHSLTESCSNNKSTCFNWKEFGEVAIKTNQKIYDLGYLENLEKILMRPFILGCASLTPNSYVIDPKGDIYKCWNTIGIKNYSVGNIDDGIKLNKENISWLTLEKPKECTECTFLPLCQGGCPYNRMVDKNNLACTHNKITYKETLKLMYNDYKKKKAL